MLYVFYTVEQSKLTTTRAKPQQLSVCSIMLVTPDGLEVREDINLFEPRLLPTKL